MIAEITMSQLWMNPTVAKFFFRKQAWRTLETILLEMAVDHIEAIEQIENYCTINDYTVDDLEELLYNETEDYIISEIGIEVYECEEVE